MFRTASWLGVLCMVALMATGCEQPQQRGEEVGMSAGPGEGERPASAYRVGWNQIRSGMKHSEVLSLLGEPVGVKVTRVNTYWYYSERGSKGPHVILDTSAMTVDRWTSPESK